MNVASSRVLITECIKQLYATLAAEWSYWFKILNNHWHLDNWPSVTD